jgi:hypothetical protein
VRIHPLFKWFGSKWSSGRLYPEPQLPTIIEPFAGSAGYSLNHADKQVHLWDTHPRIAELWGWLIQEATQALVLDIPLNVPEGTDVRSLGLSAGQALLLRMWQRTNNCSECWTISKWGHLPGQWTANTRARVAEEVTAIKHWRFGLPWGAIATYHVDPPYLFNYRYGAKPFSYDELAQHLLALPAACQIMVCEAAHPKTGEIPGYLPFEHFARRVTSRRAEGNHTHSSELMWHRAAQ